MLHKLFSPKFLFSFSLFLLVTSFKVSIAAEVDMSEVKRLTKLPVENILQGSPVVQVTDPDHLKWILENNKPLVVVFYVNLEKNSRNLATLIRYLAFDLHEKITFYSFKVSERGPIGKELAVKLQEAYSLDKTPATFFYNNGSGKMNLRHENNGEPTIKEYRTPSMFFWKKYYEAVVQYIKNSLIQNKKGSKIPTILTFHK